MVTIELMRTISAAFNSRDIERIVDCFAEEATFCLARGPEPVGRTLRGKAAIRQALRHHSPQTRARTATTCPGSIGVSGQHGSTQPRQKCSQLRNAAWALVNVDRPTPS